MVDQQGADQQAALWNGTSGNAWVENQDLMDGLLRPVQDVLVDAVTRDAEDVRAVLDIGCGTGGLTVALAQALGATCTGVDISGPMLDGARARAEEAGVSAAFVLADAQTHEFEPGAADLVVSRFGVMFFDDPVRAFANLRVATRAGGRLHVITWRGIEENPFFTTAERAVAHLVPELPARDPDGPGQFGLSDPERVERILTGAGWSTVRLVPHDVPCALPAADLETYVTRFGLLGRVLGDVEEPRRTKVVAEVLDAFGGFTDGDEVRATAACWSISATA